jgi:hypothetical protein
MPHRIDLLSQLLADYPLFLSMPRREKLFSDYEAERDADKSVPPSSKATRTIYTLKVTCVSGTYLTEPCVRVLEMKDNSTLMDLHYAIPKAVQFDCDHRFEFFIGPHERRRSIIFSEDHDDITMEEVGEIALRRIWPLPKKMKLIYHFDFGDDWKFHINKARATKPPEKGVRYPRIVESVGPNPKQYPDYGE